MKMQVRNWFDEQVARSVNDATQVVVANAGNSASNEIRELSYKLDALTEIVARLIEKLSERYTAEEIAAIIGCEVAP